MFTFSFYGSRLQTWHLQELKIAEGGHDVPSEDVKRRFGRGIKNLFKFYRPLLDLWMFFDNAGSIPQLIVEEKNGRLSIINKKLYDTIIKDIL